MTQIEPDFIQGRRALIDLVAETRSRAVRVALFGTQLHRPDPDARETSDRRTKNLRVLVDTVDWIERVSELLTTGKDPWGELDARLCEWLNDQTSRTANFPERIRGLAKVSQLVKTAAETKPADLGRALEAHYDYRRSGLMDAVTAFCDGMWATMDAEREEDLALAAKTGDAIQKALSELERIGKHVRLVSLNAAVEAARMGDAGRGMSVLSVEFKVLAEQVQTLAASAQDEISNLTKNRNEQVSDRSAPKKVA